MFITDSIDTAWRNIQESKANFSLFSGDSFDLIKKIPDNSIDLVVTSPPYCMGKEYESSSEIDDFISAHKAMLPDAVRILKPGGSICWQVGNYVKNGEVIPLDFLVYDLLRGLPDIKLRNRIVWTFGHGLHCRNRFSGRHETILWFTKGDSYDFNLDAVRVRQKYPGKRADKGPKKGEFSGNPLGKNPSDVWDIPNVKANHIEKTDHPCQFPVALVQRLVRALSPINGIVFDPFCGVGSSGVAAAIEGRKFIGAEINEKYIEIASNRIKSAASGEAKVRPLDLPVYEPKETESVARRPDHFWISTQG